MAEWHSDQDYVLELADLGYSQKAIAREMDWSVERVSDMLSQALNDCDCHRAVIAAGSCKLGRAVVAAGGHA